jgi:hypothetical protein
MRTSCVDSEPGALSAGATIQVVITSTRPVTVGIADRDQHRLLRP